MGTLRIAWKVASAGKGGGGVVLAGGGLLALMVAEARLARDRVGRAIHPVPDANGSYGVHRGGTPLRLAIIGDSSAAGYGVHDADETPPAVMAARTSELLEREVQLTSYAVVGARSFDLATQAALAIQAGADIAVILVGANDVTHLVPHPRAARYMRDAVLALRRANIDVIVGTCPDLGTIKPILPPLRDVGRILSRRLATRQAAAVIDTGARTVSLGSLLGPEFYADPKHLFGPDGFHPSAEGYRRVSMVLSDAIAAQAHARTHSSP
jgi:lysophospholipase L1-like esterase